MEIVIDKEKEGKTVLEILKKELGLSSKMITALKKKENGITVDKAHVTVRYVLKEDQLLAIDTEDTESNENLLPIEMPLDIVFEDDDILLINKPPMLPTHPSHGHFDDTLANGVCFYMRQKGAFPFVFRSINRLDRDTSGLVLIAKNRLSASRLYSSMRNGLISKKYIALLCGELTKQSGTVDTYIRRKQKSIITREVCGPLHDAARAVTEYNVIAASKDLTAVVASPKTGRTHQLRLHFSYLGAPIMGDELYGSASNTIGRQALHAFSLTFPHPTLGKVITFKAPLPRDMKTAAELHHIKIEV